MLDRFLTDLQLSLRRLRRVPGTSLPALLAVLLAGTALMLASALVAGVLLKPLPYPDAERLQYLSWRQGPADTYPRAMTATQARFFLDQAGHLATLGSYADAGTQYTLDGARGGLAQRVSGLRADAGLLPTLGLTPSLGRNFQAAEARDGAKVAIVSARLWRERFAAQAPGAAQLRIDGELHSVIGVLPEGFRFYPEVELLVPSLPGGIGAGGSNTHLLARLPQGVEVASLQQQLQALGERFAAEQGLTQGGARLLPLAERVVGDSAGLLLPLAGAVALLVLLACVNVANLLIGLSLARRGDAAVELALGASRRRLAARLIIDAGLVWALGLALSALAAALILPRLADWVPFPLPRLAEVSLDATSLALALCLGAVMTLVCAGLSVLGARIGSLAGAIRSQGAGRGAGVGAQPWLVSAQVALSCVLLVGTALMLGSFLRLAGTDPGFRSAGVQTVQLALADARYRDEAQATARSVELLAALERELAALPGVRAVASSSSLPLETGLNNWIELPPGASAEGASVEVRSVSDDYLDLLAVPLLAGESAEAGDRSGGERRVLVNASLARAYFGDVARAAGASLRMDGHDWRVAGVVADMHEASLRLAPLPTLFVPRAQMDPAIQAAVNRWFTSALLVDAEDFALEAAVRAALQRIDPGVALVRVRPLDGLVGASLATERFFGALLAVLAVASLLMSGIGLYGVLGQLQWLRRHELAVRLALGSDAGGNTRLLLAQGLRWTASGLLAGVPLALLARSGLERLLHASSLAGDAPLLALAGAALLGACLMACLAPAWRARRIQPGMALRCDG